MLKTMEERFPTSGNDRIGRDGHERGFRGYLPCPGREDINNCEPAFRVNPHLESMERKDLAISPIRQAVLAFWYNLSARTKLTTEVRKMENFGIRFNLPEIRLPRFPTTETDCEAAPICKHIGNLRQSCLKGSSVIAGQNISKCIASMVILMGRIANINLEPPLPSKPIQGFSGQGQATEDAGGKV